MITITLPDGSARQYPAPVTGDGIAASIGEGLRKAALAMVVDGKLVDLKTPLTADAKVSLVTAKTPDGIDIIRHSTAHILAQAIKELYPTAQITIGPVIENGFYYDVAFEKAITSDDLAALEARMADIVKRDLPIQRDVWTREKAIAHFKGIGEHYKAEIVADLPAGDEISVYSQGDFLDLCRGPHLPSTGKAGAFKLLSLAGAYWRGDSKNAMLTRIYGTAWATEKELKDHLRMLEEAAKRDHRKLGREMDLFHLQDDAPGQVFWHPKGWTLYRTLENYIRDKIAANGYVEVNTPQLVSSEMYKKSGHWDKFGTENMFVFKEVSNERELFFAMKPMNCPCHIQIFNVGIKSYRDLPLRMAEFGACMRNEAQGAMHGIMRVRAFKQDDAHIFCTTEQMPGELVAFCHLLREVYQEIGFTNVAVKLSTRPEKRVGADALWDQAEAALAAACDAAGLTYGINPGEGAFYGPKLEFQIRDAIGRNWQCGTLQVDFNLPGRLDAEYVGPDGQKHTPVMLHRAILGSLERFTGILIENFAGHFPLWLAPVQVVVSGIVDKQNPAVEGLVAKLKAAGLRAEADTRNEKINLKIREHSLQKVPVFVVLGDKEVADGTATVRRLGSTAQTTVPVDALIANLLAEVASKSLPPETASNAA